MVFSSEIFLFLFLPITIIGYYIIKENYRNIWLLLASLFFYSWGEPKYVLLMIFSIIGNYIWGLLLERTRESEQYSNLRTVVLTISIIFNIGLLGYFKYFDFLISNFNQFTGCSYPLNNITLPIGISFFTFQNISYVVDVYRGEDAQHNILDLGLYIALFPQLIAGPIVRYSNIKYQIHNREISIDKFYSGCLIFMMGFSKKILIADQVAPLVDSIFSKNGISAMAAWVGAIAYTLQIYFDFSGYSDMAIGLGRMFGFEFMRNFDYPYISETIKEFWRRWHISLSSWFRDYVYIPLGGSRCKTKRAFFNLIVVFLLTGLWHGANWNFIAWGMYYVFFLIIERIGFGNFLKRVPMIISHGYSLIVIVIGWVLFRAEGLLNAIVYYKNMFNFSESAWIDLASHMNKEYTFAIIAGVVFSFPIGEKVYELGCNGGKNIFYSVVSVITLFFIFILAICYMVGSGFSPFLYFRF